jgi:metal-responsive CopG/Arc/MetJ family transcriptional regulator
VPATIKRVVVEFPTPLLNRAELALTELAINRSELIRKALERYLEALEQAKLEQELADGYTANAAQARSLCQEFAHVDGDTI